MSSHHVLCSSCAQISIRSAFYLTFWQLSSYDLYYPKQKYLETEKHLLSQAESYYNRAKQAEKSADKSIRASSNSLRAQKERYQSVAAELKKERQTQEIIYRFTTDVDGRLEKEKTHWLSHGESYYFSCLAPSTNTFYSWPWVCEHYELHSGFYRALHYPSMSPITDGCRILQQAHPIFT